MSEAQGSPRDGGRYEIQVRLDVTERNAAAARERVEAQLRAAGFDRWQLVRMRARGVGAVPIRRRRRLPRRAPGRRDQVFGGTVLVAAIVAWWLWFFWSAL